MKFMCNRIALGALVKSFYFGDVIFFHEEPDMTCCTPSSDSPKKRAGWCCGIFLVLGFLTALGVAALLRDGLRDFRGESRTVSVRGLSEREVKADLAAWPFSLSATNNDLAAAQAQLERQEESLRAFLADQGLSVNDISLLRYDVQDLLAQQYRPDRVDDGRYVLSKALLLRTSEVDKVAAASQSIDALVRRGVALGQGSQPNYIFTKLNDVKPDMIREANENALAAARQFAEDSGAKVGAIVTATQGVFSINGRDDIPAISNMGSFGPEMQLNKNVRVVTSVTYKLD